MKPLLLICCTLLPLTGAAQVMTFEPLVPDFADYNSYSENGLVFGAVAGGPEVFHADSLIYYGGTGSAATFYATDGQPLELRWIAGNLFNLLSLDLSYLDTDTKVRVVGSTGVSVLLDNPTTVTFGSQFSGLEWARLEFDAATPLGGYAVVDNLTVQPIPEVSSWGAGLVVGMLSLNSLRRRTVNSSH